MGCLALQAVKECLESVRDDPELWSCTQEAILDRIINHLEEKINAVKCCRERINNKT